MSGERPESGRRVLVEQLIGEYEGALRRFIAERSGPKMLRWTTVDDLYQLTVKRALKSAETFEYRSDEYFIQWILTIARRVISRPSDAPRGPSRLVRLKNPESSGPGVVLDQLWSPGRTPSSDAALSERRNILRAAIATLPVDQGRALTMLRIEQMQFATVAAKMDRSEHALTELVRRAQKSLVKKLSTQDESQLF